MTHWNNDTVRQLERQSIRGFMEKNRHYLKGRVLDFGAGKQPYRDLVHGTYTPIEKYDPLPCAMQRFESVMCNQVFQYLEDPQAILIRFNSWLREEHGHLVMTYPTNWDEVESTDLFRYTRAGMEHLLTLADFEIVSHERRAEINLNGFKFPLGYGVVARAS